MRESIASAIIGDTCAVSEMDKADTFPNDHFRHWKFSCRGWNDLQMMYAPILSLKEQYKRLLEGT
jgi:hypothetical protein